ncbi:MFS transporter, partial [Eisenbergiella tayi]
TSGTVAGFASKIGSGIGSGILGILLGAAGFVSTATGESVTQPAAAMTMIRCLYSIVPAVLFTIMLLFTILYSKLDKLMPDIDQTLQSRRAAAKKTD